MLPGTDATALNARAFVQGPCTRVPSCIPSAPPLTSGPAKQPAIKGMFATPFFSPSRQQFGRFIPACKYSQLFPLHLAPSCRGRCHQLQCSAGLHFRSPHSYPQPRQWFLENPRISTSSLVTTITMQRSCSLAPLPTSNADDHLTTRAPVQEIADTTRISPHYHEANPHQPGPRLRPRRRVSMQF